MDTIKEMERNIIDKIENRKVEVDNIKEMEKNILEKIENNKVEVNQEDTPYRAALMSKLEKKVNEINKNVKQIRKGDDIQTGDDKDKKLIRIVLKPNDVNIRNSKSLRKQFNEHFPQVILKHARISAGGSYVFEFDEEEAANDVEQHWSKNHFAGNAGIVKMTDRNLTGLVKFVYDDLEEEDIINSIIDNYPGCKYELFKKDEEFTGMIKVTFRDETELNTAITNKFNICHRKYITEPFKHKPRVIKCNVCQRLGHVSRLCRSKEKPVCGKCSREGHESKNCQTPANLHKCFHCGKPDHITGSYSCEKMKEKLQELIDRQDGL